MRQPEIKKPSERDSLDLFELVCQLSARYSLFNNENMHNAFFEAKNEMIKRLQEYAAQCAGGWVKASERLPEDCWQGKIRLLTEDSLKEYTAMFFLDKNRFDSNVRVFQPRNVEWLSETVASKEKVAGDAIAFLEWQTDNRYVWEWNKNKFVAAWDNYAEYTAAELFEVFKVAPDKETYLKSIK